ncbi:MAG: DUF484 family protein [Gammaproteobacteria bacterium]|jgi:uncharacterized protein YigA (DUF484 family)
MSSPSDDNAAPCADLPDALAVAAYLKANPAFFADHPDVLHEIDIRHASGGAVSLLERQVTSLRTENQRLKAQFHELVQLAEANQRLITRIHQLALLLMEAAGPQAIFATLADHLMRDFNAERVRTLVFAEPACAESPPLPEFVGADCGDRTLFRRSLERREAQCGELAAEQAAYLFPEANSRGSAVLLPLGAKSWDGLLVVSSDDANRFNDDMGTEFLTYLGDVVSFIVDPWVARSKVG